MICHGAVGVGCQQPTTSSQHKVEYQVTLLDNREKRGGGGRNQDRPAGIADQLYYVERRGIVLASSYSWENRLS